MSDENPESEPESTAGMVENIGEQVASGLEGAAESMAGDEEKEAVADGLETAGDIAAAVSQGAAMVEGAQGIAEGLREGDGLAAASAAGDWVSGIAGTTGAALDGVADLVDSDAVREVLQTASSVTRGISGAARSARGVISTAEDIVQSIRGQKVKYELHLDGEGDWNVLAFTLTEAISEPYEMVLEVKTEDREADVRALVGAEAELLIERGDEHHRRVTGIVRRVVESNDRSHHVTATLHVVPAFWALGQGSDSVIFQDKTAVEILDIVLNRHLSPYRREIDLSQLGDGYARREYCVQYRESHLAFCQRLMEEEGISYCFDADGEGHEKLVLWDRNGGVASVPTVDDNPIPFRNRVGVVTASNEPIVELSPARRMTATYQTVRDYDWTRDRTRVEASVEGEDEQGRARSVYDHGHGRGVSLYDFQPGQRYQQNDVERQAQRRHEGLVRDADLSGGASLVIGMAPGHRFEVSEHPTPGMDGEYLVTRVVHRKAAPEGAEHHAEGEAYSNTFECIPFDAEYRPTRRTPKPSIFGVQTAMVTGGNPGEIATDEYGRVQVLFRWDREGAEPTSCWLRVAQVWAGHDGMGYPGFVFIPRVGMEVIVTFIDGDPDRPLVTGSVYNGTNLPPESLPDEASRSMIRTRSLNGTGYNELSFEDARGNEEVHLRAERNLRELVQHDHDTHVVNNQTNTVDNDQFEKVGRHQEMTVLENRTKTVLGDEKNTIDKTRTTGVTKDDSLTVGGNRSTTIQGNETRDVTQDRTSVIQGHETTTIHNGMALNIVSGGATQLIDDGGWTLGTTGDVTHTMNGNWAVGVTGNGQFSFAGSWATEVTGGARLSAASVDIVSQSGVTIKSNAGVREITPAADELVASSAIETISRFNSSVGIKCSVNSVALGLALMKLSVVKCKVDDVDFKLAQTGLSCDATGVKLKIVETVDLNKALLTMIG